MTATLPGATAWPALPYPAWRETCATLHRYTQIVGKIRLATAPMVNHYWQVALYVDARGLTTSAMPWRDRTFEIRFDLVGHALQIVDSLGNAREVALTARPVADFYAEVFTRLRELGIDVAIRPTPNELLDATPLDRDRTHRSYDPDAVTRFFAALTTADRLMKVFRGRWLGKSSPVHFFWGSFDHAVTRFSGERAPPHPGGVPDLPDRVTREAYSHEVSSCGFWPGGDAHPEPVFYAYAYPEPPGFRERHVRPAAARFVAPLGEFVLPWESALAAPDPDAAVLEFFQSTYEATADLGNWDRAALER